MCARTAGIITLLCAIFLGSALPVAQEPQPPAIATTAQIERWIAELGSEQFNVREAASRSLAGVGNRARRALEAAAKSTDAEVAARAKTLLDALPKLSHTIVDALGQPIGGAHVVVRVFRQPPSDAPLPAPVSSVSEEDGRIGIPEVPQAEVPVPGEPGVARRLSILVEVAHVDYGTARIEVDRTAASKTLVLPLVRQGTEPYQRAIAGQIVAPEGKPVSGAVIHCENIRTPGEGLIEGSYPRGQTVSDREGRFTYYLPPSQQRQSQRGALTPANSRYQLLVTVPGDDSFFPWSGWYSNLQPVRVELPRPTRFHRFRFETVGGGIVSDHKQLKQARVRLDRMQDGQRLLTDIGDAAVTDGRKLIPGKYVAECFANGKTIEYLPLTVTDDSPEELTFRLPHAVTYRGRVTRGITGEPVAGAIIVGWNSTSHNNLALLTADDWQMLRDTPSNPPDDHPAITRLREFYGVQALVRTDREGRFEIVKQPDQEFYGLLAFDQHALPFKVTVGALKPDPKHQIDVGEFPLFPAAKIVVRPVFDGQSLAVSPRWNPADSGQPEWFAKFKASGRDYQRGFEYVHWLTLNEPQPVYVPAGVRLTVRFDTPYDDKWDAAVVKDIDLEPRATKEIGDLHFPAKLPVSVRVVDRQGKPIEGVPVRQKYVDDNAWSVAHNTDKDGLAQFHAPRNSEAEFWVSDLPGTMEARMAANLSAKLKVGDASPAEPATITLTDAQAELLVGKGK